MMQPFLNFSTDFVQNLILGFIFYDYFVCEIKIKTNSNEMPFENDKDLSVKFLKCLSKIKDWQYHDKIEEEKKREIKEFIGEYIFKDIYGEILHQKISYNRINFLVNHPFFKPTVKALLVLLELSDTEKEFNEHYQKMTVASF